MSNSKLQQYIDIAKFITDHGPQTFNQIRTRSNISKASLPEDLEFLSNSGFIKRQSNGQYSISNTGINILTFFNIAPSEKTIKIKRR